MMKNVLKTEMLCLYVYHVMMIKANWHQKRRHIQNWYFSPFIQLSEDSASKLYPAWGTVVQRWTI